MANVPYENFVLANEIEDQFNSHLDLARFVTVDNSLVGTAGMIKKIHKYSATNGAEKLAKGEGNTKFIEAAYAEEEYRIALAQNTFRYYDEDQMTDPVMVDTGIRHLGTDLFNTEMADIFAEYNKATLAVEGTAYNFDVFADAVAKMNLENLEGVEIFAFVNAEDMGKLRKGLKDDLKYVEAFARSGYVGTVAGVNIYTKKDAVTGTCIVATRQAVTLFNKKGTEVEQKRDGDKRQNDVISRKYYVCALTDETKAVKITVGA